MSAESVREIVLSRFRAARVAPSAPFEDERFLAFLSEPPQPKGKRPADTFAARRRYVLFIEAVELACGVCFTKQEWERGYSLADFVALVEAKAAKPSMGLRLADERATSAKRRLPGDLVKFGVLTSPLLGLAAYWRGSLWTIVPLGAWLAVLCVIAYVSNAEIRHYSALRRHLAGERRSGAT